MNFRHKLLKFWNFWPPFLFTGIKLTKISPDFREVTVKLKLRFWNANYVGTQYGGSIFSMSDAFYMVMLMKNLGSNYIVWDKSACITFIKPGRTDLIAEFQLTEDDLALIRATLETQPKMDWPRKIEIKDTSGTLIAVVDKLIHIRNKSKD